MRADLLLDTGPLVALLDADQTAHLRCVEVFRAWTGQLLTTEAVVTEATHLLATARGGRAACLDFILRGGALLVEGSAGRIARVRTLVEKYRDVPMDYADGTLVALAEERRTGKVFTLDRRGFSAYRWLRRRPFELFP